MFNVKITGTKIVEQIVKVFDSYKDACEYLKSNWPKTNYRDAIQVSNDVIIIYDDNKRYLGTAFVEET